MQKNQLILTFLTLTLLFFLFPLFWNGEGGRALLFPLYLSVGPLLGAAILFGDLKKGVSIKSLIKIRLALLSPALMLSLFGAILCACLALLMLFFEWMVTLPLLGPLFQVVLLGIPLFLTLLMVGTLFLIPLLIYFLGPILPKYGWDIRLLSKGVQDRQKKTWVEPFIKSLAPLFFAAILLWIVSPSLTPFLLPVTSPFFALQWLFLAPFIAAFFAYPLAYFYSKAV